MKTERADGQRVDTTVRQTVQTGQTGCVEFNSDRAGAKTVRTKQAERQCRQDVCIAQQTDNVHIQGAKKGSLDRPVDRQCLERSSNMQTGSADRPCIYDRPCRKG